MEANEAATQAIEAGIPETAVLVIERVDGALEDAEQQIDPEHGRRRRSGPSGLGGATGPRARTPAVSF
ncbi:MAG: hypothetical protein ACR2JK_11680 [Geodermatophilaceae bacterium]